MMRSLCWGYYIYYEVANIIPFFADEEIKVQRDWVNCQMAY